MTREQYIQEQEWSENEYNYTHSAKIEQIKLIPNTQSNKA